MYVNTKSIAKALEEHFPKHYAASWDKVGLQVGSGNSQVNKVLVTLEITPEVVQEAIDRSIDLIISHHPLIFSPLVTITEDDPIGSMVRKLILHKINVYAMHTNLDAGRFGTADYLSKLLELDQVEPLYSEFSVPYYKLVVFVPTSHEQEVRLAMTNAGAGQIGHYSHCTFTTEGTGTFKPLEGSRPYLGKQDTLEAVSEVRLEAIVPAHMSQQVVDHMIKAHPYEVPAYDLIALSNTLEGFSYAKKGVLAEPTKLKAFVEQIADKLKARGVKYVGNDDDVIRKVAVCPGAGGDYIKKAAAAGCDVLVTGDVKYHDAQLAKQLHLKVIDAGHFDTEHIFIPAFREFLEVLFDKKGYELTVIHSEALQNPFQFL